MLSLTCFTCVGLSEQKCLALQEFGSDSCVARSLMILELLDAKLLLEAIRGSVKVRQLNQLVFEYIDVQVSCS